MSALIDPADYPNCERCGVAFRIGDDVKLDAGRFVHASGCAAPAGASTPRCSTEVPS